MNEANRTKKIVELLLAVSILAGLFSSVTSFVLFAGFYARLRDMLLEESAFFEVLITYTGGLFILAAVCGLCLAKLRYGENFTMWKPVTARWNTIAVFVFLCFSVLLPLGIAGVYYSMKLEDRDFE